MAWLKEHGVISNYWDYLNLPIGVVEDTRMFMEHDAIAARQRERNGFGG